MLRYITLHTNRHEHILVYKQLRKYFFAWIVCYAGSADPPGSHNRSDLLVSLVNLPPLALLADPDQKSQRQKQIERDEGWAATLSLVRVVVFFVDKIRSWSFDRLNLKWICFQFFCACVGLLTNACIFQWLFQHPPIGLTAVAHWIPWLEQLWKITEFEVLVSRGPCHYCFFPKVAVARKGSTMDKLDTRSKLVVH